MVDHIHSGMPIIKAAAVQLSPGSCLAGKARSKRCAARSSNSAAKECSSQPSRKRSCPITPTFVLSRRPTRWASEHYKLLEQSVTVPSASTQAIGDAAKEAGMVVSIGVNERDGGTLYNAQLLFDADGSLIQKRRKLSPTYHERMVWGQGDASGLRAVDSAVGRIGSLACWEHYNPLARYALMADGEQIHSAMYPGSFAGDVFSEQISVNIRQHALESGCFVVNATAWLDAEQQAQIMKDTGCDIEPISSGCFTAIISPRKANTWVSRCAPAKGRLLPI